MTLKIEEFKAPPPREELPHPDSRPNPADLISHSKDAGDRRKHFLGAKTNWVTEGYAAYRALARLLERRDLVRETGQRIERIRAGKEPSDGAAFIIPSQFLTRRDMGDPSPTILSSLVTHGLLQVITRGSHHRTWGKSAGKRVLRTNKRTWGPTTLGEQLFNRERLRCEQIARDGGTPHDVKWCRIKLDL